MCIVLQCIALFRLSVLVVIAYKALCALHHMYTLLFLCKVYFVWLYNVVPLFTLIFLISL